MRYERRVEKIERFPGRGLLPSYLVTGTIHGKPNFLEHIFGVREAEEEFSVYGNDLCWASVPGGGPITFLDDFGRWLSDQVSAWEKMREYEEIKARAETNR